MYDKIRLPFILFLLIQIVLYMTIFLFHQRVSFHIQNYRINSHHYFKDPRAEGKQFLFLRALGQYDAQWYIKIANDGYPKSPKHVNMEDKTAMDGLTYAFFPLYPIFLALLNLPIRNIELAAFVTSNLFLILNFFSLFWVVSQLYSQRTALKTIFLLFLFPFSIFYRSYFTEGLYLFLLIWMCFFLIKRRLLFAIICLSLLNVTKANGFLLNLVILYYIYISVRLDLVQSPAFLKHVGKVVLFILILITPTLLWMLFNYFQTGDALYFYSVRSAWSHVGLMAPFYNLGMIISSPFLPFHSFHVSQVEAISVIITLPLLVISKKTLKPQLWWVSFLLWASPLLVTDLMSFSRYQIVSFPLYIFLASVLKSKLSYAIVLGIFLLGLFMISLLFVNWYWIG